MPSAIKLLMLKSNHRLTASAKALSDERIFLTASMMDTKELKIDWLNRLKKKRLFSLLGVLTVAIMVTMIFIAVNLRDT